MAVYAFEIPQGAISTGPDVPATAELITVDRGLSRESSHRVLTSRFGDGYEQRLLDGINTKQDTFSFSLNNRPTAEINKVAKFFDNYAGRSFSLKITNYDGDETIKVVCDAYNTVYIYEEVHSIQATFRRVYEP